MKSQILSRNYIQLEKEIQILKSAGWEASSLCQSRRVDAMCLSVRWQNQIKISCAVGELLLTFLRAIVANGLHMACGGFEALSCPPKPKLAMKRKPCW